MRTITAVLVSAWIAPTAHAAQRAIWDDYPKLVCRYDEAQWCRIDLRKCEASRGSAVLQFDFSKNQVTSFVSPGKPMPIAAKYHFDFRGNVADTNAVFVEGDLYSFVKVQRGGVIADTIEGFAQSASVEKAFTAHMTCHPG